ncbi:ATP-binding protein [Clostridium paraputrificum]|uniref:ATP-binding protein n=1 Tax=Clostridium paraputrificum TaxID=29363 RepID=UPI000C088994|nr:ATP-binding protein [Clostridium paraputrificum]
MRNNIIFVGGIHGVGKITVCNKIKKLLGVEAYSSSELIKKYNSLLLSKDKRVEDINKNQDILLKAISKYVCDNDIALLDGHFTLISKDGAITDIPIETFLYMELCSIVMVVDKPDKIVDRLRSRDSKDYSLKFVDDFQTREINRANYVSGVTGINLYYYEYGSDISDLIEFINKYVKKD